MTLIPQPINFTEKWKSLQETLKGIMKVEQISRNTWNESFNDIYYLCIAIPEPFAFKLYESTKLFLENHLLELLSNIQNGGDANLLQNYHTHWQKYSIGINYLNSLYQYLNKHYIKKYKSCCPEVIYGNVIPDIEYMEIKELGLHLWKYNLIVPLKNSLVKLLLDVFDKHECYESSTTSLNMIACVIYSFVAVHEFKKNNPLSLYHSCFEQPFLEQSSKRFKCYAARLLQECTISKYLVKVLRTLEREGIKSKKYFHRNTYFKVRELCRQNMVSDHLEFLLHESETIIKEERQNDMQNIYLLLHGVKDGMNSLVDIFKEHVLQCGIRLIETLGQEQIHVHFVEKLSAIHKKFKTMIIDVFHNDLCFNSALDTAFKVVINHKLVKNQPSKSPEYLSQYCDYLLKKSTKDGIKEIELDQKLTQSIIIFKYIDDKDIFLRYYQRYLAKRLIHQQSQSMDGEEEMIKKLKNLCGFEYTSKLHRMLIDFKVSEELMTEFHNVYLKSENKLNINFTINVLQTGAWPSSSISSFFIPKQLIPCTQYFEEFYKLKFGGRKLTWLFHLCHGELKLNYLSKVYMVSMQTFHIAILLLFEDNNTLKYSVIQELLEITNDQIFQKHIKSLVDCKLLLIDGDNVSLNMAYSNKRTKLRLTVALQKDIPQEELKQTINSVESDRKAYLQAAIVRIMKARKVLKHNQLVNEVLTQSKSFVPSNILIKTCIEVLIDKEYLERSSKSPDTYSYIA